MTHSANYTFTLSSKGGVAPYTWVDYPSGTVGYFVDPATSVPLNGFYLIPGIDRTCEYLQFELTISIHVDPQISALRVERGLVAGVAAGSCRFRRAFCVEQHPCVTEKVCHTPRIPPLIY